MRTDEEREEYDLMRGRLMLIARTLEAVKDIPDDGSSSYAMDTIIREDVPAALTIIDRQRAELQELRNVAKVAEDYIRDGGVAYAQRTACREYRCMERSDVR